MHVQAQPATPAVGTAAANTQVQVVITGVAGRRVMLTSLLMGFSGAVAAAPVRATVSDGTTTMGFALAANLDFEPANALAFAAGATVTITLPAGGASAVGDIVAGYYLAKSDE